MITVYHITKSGEQNTRLHLPGSAWGYSVLEKLKQMGYAVLASSQRADPDLRGKAELARVDELLEATGL